MMDQDTPCARVRQVFGLEQFPEALFYQADFALRFELGADLSMQHQLASRFLQAMDRSRQVAAALFEGAERLTVVIRYSGDMEWRTGRRRTLLALARAGFRLPLGPVERLRNPYDDPEYPVMNNWHQIEIANDPNLIAAVLWCVVAAEMPISPKGGMGLFDAYIVDFDAGSALHVYDDRGMDVIATTRDILRPLYERFGDWLLHWDRPQMDESFAT